MSMKNEYQIKLKETSNGTEETSSVSLILSSQGSHDK